MRSSDLDDFKLYEYIEITTLSEGDIFREFALQNSSKKEHNHFPFQQHHFLQYLSYS